MPQLARPLLALAITLGTFTLHAQSATHALVPSDIDRLAGNMWTGSLAYRDYTSDKQTRIRSTLQVARLSNSAQNAAAWEMRVGYNDEPNENSRDTVRLSADGRTFRGQTVMERDEMPGGTLRLVTEQDGEDNNRPARIRLVYLISASAVSIQKFVRYKATDSFFERHIYRWAR